MPSRIHIVLITTKQPASNPRIVKEAIALKKANYQVSVIYNFWSQWASKADEEILNQNPEINWIIAGYNPYNFSIFYWYSRARHKVFRILARYFSNNFWLQTMATAQFYPEIKRQAARIKAALYIAHNHGALPAALFAAQKNNSKFAFDAEDFHREQEQGNVQEYDRVKLIDDRCLSQAKYITVASQLIGEEYKKHYPLLTFTVVNNVLSKSLQPVFQALEKQPLKLFWFSQTVGLNRGIQDVILAINRIREFPVLLTILGDLKENVRQNLEVFLQNKVHRLYFLPPCGECELVKQSAIHHIGLALEPGFSVNNNIALSNKLFTYLLAGNAVIVSSTPSQKLFYNQYPEVGWCYSPGDIIELTNILYKAYNDQEMLLKKRNFAWKLAHATLNWENEQVGFLELIKDTLSKKF